MIIDTHTHIAKEGTTHPEMVGGSSAELFKYMQLRGVSRCVVLPISSEHIGIQASFTFSTEEVLDLSSRFPENIIPSAYVDWRWDPRAIEKLRNFVEKGCKAFGEVDHQLVVDDSRILPLYNVCGELGIPVLMHIDSYPVNPDLDGLMRVLREFPSTNFVAHGPGWWRHISKEVLPDEPYPWGKVVSGGKVDLILQRFPNAYADISANSGLRALQRDFSFAHEFAERNKDKLLYGTDFPCKNWINKERSGVDGLHLTFLRSLGLSEGTFERITYRNVERLLKLP